MSTLLKESPNDTIVLEKEAKIILVNDNVNSFNHVINCLIKYCKHGEQQAEQCAIIIHNKGSYIIKEGNYDNLLPIYHALIENGLIAELE